MYGIDSSFQHLGIYHTYHYPTRDIVQQFIMQLGYAVANPGGLLVSMETPFKLVLITIMH